MDLSAASIRHARVPARTARRAQARRSLEDWLRDAEPQRYGLPATAIVLVRDLRLPWADLALACAGGRDPSLAAAIAAAVRPAAGSTPAAGVPCVWFADLAELLACLARDALGGPPGRHWWWRLLLRGGSLDAAARRWIAEAREVPRALQRLEAGGQGHGWIEAMGAPARRTLLDRLARHYPIDVGVQRWVHDGADPGALGDMAGHGPDAMARLPPAATAGVPLDATPAEPAAMRLLRLGLDLAADPACAASTSYLARSAPPGDPMVVRGTTADPSRVRTVAAAAEASVPGQSGRRLRHAPVPDQGWLAELDRPVPAATPSTAPAGRSRARPTDAPALLPVPASRPALRSPPAVDPVLLLAPATPAAPAPPPAAQRADAAAGLPAPATPAPPDPASPAPAAARRGRVSAVQVAAQPGTTFDTGHGGLFFVLNAAIGLGLYGDFTQPLHSGWAMSPWRLLRIAGQALGGRGWRADPLAAWLARQPPGAVPEPVDAAAAWRIDPTWLPPFDHCHCHGQGQAVWRDGKLRLVHPAGFAVFEAAVGTDRCDALIDAEAAGLGWDATQLRRSAILARSPHAAARDLRLARMLPYLRARLALALGLADPDRLARELIALAARVRVAPGRVDVHYALDALPLPVRLAGLDRDPGWVPAAGCDVRFHFH